MGCYEDLRSFIRAVEGRGLLERVSTPVSTRYEAACWLKKYDGKKAVLFEKPSGYAIRVVGNLLCNRELLYMALGVSSDSEAFDKLLKAMNTPLKLSTASEPGYYERLEGVDALPVLECYEGEAGPYITAGIVIAREPRGEALNASIHRLLVLDKKRLAIRIVPRHLYAMYEKARKLGEDLPVAIVIGASPEIYIAAASSPPYGVFELEVANALADGRLRVFEAPNGLPVPLGAEVVIIGRIRTDIKVPEGPFVDALGILDRVREQPVVEVDEVLIRRKGYYYTVLQGGSEHMILMGFPREAAIWDAVRKVVPYVKSVRLIKAGGGWLTAAISLRKNAEGDSKNAILAAFAAHPSLKIAIVVDEDVDVDDANELLWAITTRTRPAEDLIIVKGVRGSSLDPSADRGGLLTSKLGIDATIPLSEQREKFLKARIPCLGEK